MTPDLRDDDPDDDYGPLDRQRPHNDDEAAVSWRVGVWLGGAVVGLGLLALWSLLGGGVP